MEKRQRGPNETVKVDEEIEGKQRRVERSAGSDENVKEA